MTATTGRRPPIDTVAVGEAVRFDRVERLLHAANALLVLVLLATGSVMYFGPLSGLFGGRTTVEVVHLWAGLALPVPFLLTTVGPWRAGFRRDVRRLGRFTADDRRWLRNRGRRRAAAGVGKFNAGQKVNAILVAGALPVMLATGAMLEWNARFSDPIRTGATFVHDWVFLGLGLLVAGHIRKALQDTTSLRSMWGGRVPMSWARARHPRWHAELGRTDRPDGPLR